MHIKDNEDIFNIWENAFFVLETAFKNNNMSDGLINTISSISNFVNAKDIKLYKYDKSTKEYNNCISLDQNIKNINSFYKNGKIIDKTKEIKLKTKNNSYIIIISNYNMDDKILNNNYLPILKRIFNIILNRLELEENLHIAAKTDSLTQVGNRYYYNEYLKELYKYKNLNVTYSLVDLFRLKYVNDNFGHAYGDSYIVKVTHLINNELDEDDLLFRVGGDEFVILSMGLKKDQITQKLDRVNEKLKDMLSINNTDDFAFCINYGVVEGKFKLDEFYLKADEIMVKHKNDTYNELGVKRRK